MVTDENKVIVRRFFEAAEEFWRSGDANVFDRALPPDYVNHTPDLPPDREGFKQAIPQFRAAFPDLRIAIEDLVTEGDKVAVRVTNRGRHRGEFMGIPPTAKPITVTELHIWRVADGRLVERWGEWDALGLLQQLGALPAPGQPGPAAAAPAPPPGSGSGSADENKALRRRFDEAVWERRDLAAVDAFFAPDFVDHAAIAGFAPGREGVKQRHAALFAAFPDCRLTIEDMVAEGDRVATRFAIRGTHRGEFFGIPPTDRPVTVTGIDVVRMAGGKIVEHWINFDHLGLLRQLGAIPAPGSPGV